MRDGEGLPLPRVVGLQFSHHTNARERELDSPVLGLSGVVDISLSPEAAHREVPTEAAEAAEVHPFGGVRGERRREEGGLGWVGSVFGLLRLLVLARHERAPIGANASAKHQPSNRTVII
ncbi:hypothetical protein ZHAS_00009510 [Anopheles sinensis]|uniref:Uncharacterized protein n=1 Tax=Anopheles sinensis TaxID=74873 RepID=A0A084VVF2_ANOSI|nr:hypothetical protein ZHAS_00009510 [Anopheles sinensis]